MKKIIAVMLLFGLLDIIDIRAKIIDPFINPIEKIIADTIK